MNQVVSIRPAQTTDDYGEITHGPAVEYRCYIDSEPHQTVDQSGQQVTSNSRIYLAGPVSVSIDDLVILPGESPRERPIVAVALRYDDEGPHHTEVHV